MIFTSERDIIIHLKQGSIEAFNLLYEKYARLLFAYALQYSKTTEEAEEVVQDVFLHLWRIHDKIVNEDTIRPLLFRMTASHLIDAFRTHLNSPIYEDYIAYSNQLPTLDHSRIEYEEFLEKLQKLMRQLPEKQRIIITKIKIENIPQDQVAKELNLSIQTVRNLLSMGIKKLNDIIQKGDLLILLILSTYFNL